MNTSPRLLVMATHPDLHTLASKHVEIEWPDATIVTYHIGEDPPLDKEFAATGFDAVVVVSAAPTEAAEWLAAELLARPEFAPILLILVQDPPARQNKPMPGLYRIEGRKIDRKALVACLEAASREHRRMLAVLRGRPNFDLRYRFGSVRIRGHRCVKKLGGGGMSLVYLAESERAGSMVVLKVFNQVPDVSDRMISFDRFLQEYEIVAGLRHRNIVRIYDLGVADDHAYIAMEYFPAGDLRNRMKTGMAPMVALDYLKQIGSALDAIHSVGVLHRDLKPANIMLRTDGSVCLIDFGLAKSTERELELTQAREIFGTPYYMSPEQGHAETIDARSDLYSLGIIFYEMLIGTKPYKGASAMEVIHKHKRAELPAIPQQFDALKPLIHKLLAKAPGDRIQTARELLDVISKIEAAA
jgi:eukaryotic-like serine/threonine-protein kinase